MTINGILQIALYFILLLAITKPFGGYMTKVFSGEGHWLTPILNPLEHFIYRLAGVDPKKEQTWIHYTMAMLFFSLAGFISLYFLQRYQSSLPLNPQGMSDISPDLAFNTSISFITNTNWQAYGGETTMSYLVQMAGLTVHNFVSAATGVSLALALIRGFARHSTKTVGNFWVDLTRCVLYVLLPISILAALVLIWQGIPQNLHAYVEASTLEGTTQTLAQGPVASQIAIKMLGTNGGGFFNANASHPYENPTEFSNLIQMLLMLSIGAALTNVFGRMVGKQLQGWALFGAMSFVFLIGTFSIYAAESSGNPALTSLGVDQKVSELQPGGNMEGKEARFGITNSALFANATTDASCGAVNAMHDSFTPLGGMIPIINMELGEIIFGGVGSGLYGILLFAIITMFIAGLMVGRTPEYVGKKLEAREVKMTMLAILILPFSMLGFTAIATVLPDGIAGISNNGPHGFSEILYAYTSATANNGSAFAGLNANTLFYNLTIGFAMLIGRFAMIVPMMAVAGSLAEKKRIPPSSGTFPTDNGLFVALLVGVILIVGGLTFFPVLALGPIVEHTLMQAGTLF